METWIKVLIIVTVVLIIISAIAVVLLFIILPILLGSGPGPIFLPAVTGSSPWSY